MKAMKKILALVIGMIMVMGITAMAANTDVNVTIANDEVIKDHSYTAYQIFSGTQGEEDVLGDVAWGTDVNAANLISALVGLKDNATFTGITYEENGTTTNVGAELGKLAYNSEKPNDSALALATILGHLSNNSDAANLFGQTVRDNLKSGATGTSIDKATTTFPVGYYLIVDNTTLQDGQVRNAAMLQATKNIEIALKTDKPNQEKKVGENVKYDKNDPKSSSISTGEGDSYGQHMNDTADYTIGDAVPFKLYSKVPNMTQYETYKFAFHDTMSEGLTFNPSSLKVYVNGTELASNEYELVQAVTTGKMFVEGDTFTVEFANLKTVTGATTGKEIRVEFTATLNEKAKIGQTTPGNTNESLIEYSNNPDDHGEGTTKSTPDKVIVFTYELDVTKIDGKDANKKLKDAEFKLHKDGKWLQVYDGTEAVGGATPKKGTVKGWVDSEANGSVFTTPESGKFEIIGLDAGTYYLKETKAPTGYNILTDEIKLEVIADTSNGQNGAGATTELVELKLRVNDAVAEDGTTPKFVGGTLSTGIVATDVENNSGATLPSTGGMGTTIFYIIGAILVIGAGILLVSKKRMSAN